MKKVQLIFCFLALSLVTTYAQDDDFMDQIVEKACSCAKELDFSSMEQQAIQEKLGLCMIQNLMNMDQEKLKTMNVDMTDQKKMNEFSQKMALKMASKCPDVMMKMAMQQGQVSTAPSSSSKPDTKGEFAAISGTVKGIVGKDLTFVQLEDASGSISAFMWLDQFEGEAAFRSNPEAMIGKKVRITYDKIDVYSPNSKTYSSRKVIKSLSVE